MEDYSITHGFRFLEETIPSIKAQGLSTIAMEHLKSELVTQKRDLIKLSIEANDLIDKYGGDEEFDYAHCVLFDITSQISVDIIDEALKIL